MNTNSDIDALLKEYQEARDEPNFDGKKSERMAELQSAILEYLFNRPSIEGLDLENA